MNKILTALVLTLMGAAFAFSEPRNTSFDAQIGPATSQAVTVTISTPTASQYNCLTELVVTPSSGTVPVNFTVDLISINATGYAVDATTGNVVSLKWPETDPWCAAKGGMLGISVNPLVPGVFNTNYKGYLHK